MRWLPTSARAFSQRRRSTASTCSRGFSRSAVRWRVWSSSVSVRGTGLARPQARSRWSRPRSIRSSSAGSTRSSSGSMVEKLPVAFLAGLFSVVTPCVLPLVPGYLSAVSAVEVDRLGERGVSRRVVVAGVPVVIGFTAVFVLLGAAAAAVGSAVVKRPQIEIAGFVLVVLGLAFLRVLPWPERAVAPVLLQRA